MGKTSGLSLFSAVKASSVPGRIRRGSVLFRQSLELSPYICRRGVLPNGDLRPCQAKVELSMREFP